MFDNSDKSRAVQKDGLAGTPAFESLKYTEMCRGLACDYFRKESLRGFRLLRT